MQIKLEQVMAAEKSVLGAMMLEPWAVTKTIERLSASDFVIDANREIYRAMKKLHDEGRPIDFITLSGETAENEAVNRIGGLDYLVELGNFVPSAVNVEHYADMVQEYGRENRIAAGMGRISQSMEPSLPQLKQLVEREEARIKPVEEGAGYIGQYMDELCDGPEKELFMTGYPTFDEYLGGLPRGSVSIVAARPRVGKTTLALCIMVHNIRSGHKTAYFSLEMTRNQLLDRISAASAKIPYGAIHRRKLDDGQKGAVCRELVDMMSGDRLNLYDNKRSSSGIISEAGRIGAALIFVDYIQKVRPDERRVKRNEEIESIMDRFKEAAVSLNAHICVLSQISREGADRPKLEHLKESGAIEEGGDIVMLLHRPTEQGGHSLSMAGELIVAKHKYGQEGYVDLQFDGTYQRFTEIAKR